MRANYKTSWEVAQEDREAFSGHPKSSLSILGWGVLILACYMGWQYFVSPIGFSTTSDYVNLEQQAGGGPGPGQIVPQFGPPAFEISGRMQELNLPVQTGYVDLTSLRKPGYYTLVMFSADWCQPCKSVWRTVPDYLRAMPNVVAVKVDLSDFDFNSNNHPALQSLRDVGGGQIPIAFLYSPLGTGTEVAKGAPAIIELLNELQTRGHKNPLEISHPNSIW